MRMRVPLMKMEERRSSKGVRYLSGDWGSVRLVIVEGADSWQPYISGESLPAGTSKPAKRRASKTPRRAKQKLTPEQRVEMLTAKRGAPSGNGFELNDDISDIGHAP